MAKTAGDAPMRRAILLLSDGEDNFRLASLNDAIAAAQRADVAIYSVSVHGRRPDPQGDRVLQAMGDATGGGAFIMRSPQQLLTAFATMESDLRSAYTLSYKPAQLEHNGQFRAIHIAPRDR